MKQSEIFKEEFELISNEELRNFIEAYMDSVPEYFYSVPASSTGKHHPKQDLGEGGLVRHTKACVHVAIDLVCSEQFVEESPYNKDIVICAALAHDTYKNGVKFGKYTVHEHPMLASEKIMEFPHSYEISKEVDIIARCIESHMGKWNENNWSEFVLPKPETEIERLVHLADYISSRKYIDFGYDM